MVKLKFFNVETLLDLSLLEGTSYLAGLMRDEAISFSKNVVGSLDSEGYDSITFRELIKYSSGFIEDKVIKKRYAILNQYFLACYERKIKKPFYIFIGGASTAGKDTLSSDLQSCLGIDRVVLSDFLRENIRNSFLRKYKSLGKVPKKYKPLFLSSVEVDDEGFNLQVDQIKKQMDKTFFSQAEREFRKWVHPFYILQGTHVVPGVESAVKGENKIIAVVSPSEDNLLSRILSRWEREMGAMDKNNEEKRKMDAKKLISVKNKIEEMAVEKGSLVIDSDSRVGVLHYFGEYLAYQLEKVLRESGVRMIKV